MTGFLPPLLAAAAITLTYIFCVRPMRQGRGCHTMPRQAAGEQASCSASLGATGSEETSASDSTASEIKRLREEVQMLQHELDLRSADVAHLGKGEPR